MNHERKYYIGDWIYFDQHAISLLNSRGRRQIKANSPYQVSETRQKQFFTEYKVKGLAEWVFGFYFLPLNIDNFTKNLGALRELL